MKIAIVGMWHLGTVTCNGLAEIGKSITCFDKKDTILKLKSGKFPIFEPGIHRLYNKNKKKIKFDYTFENLKNFNTVWITYDAKINRFDKSNSLEIEKKIKVVLKLLKKNTILIISSQCA